MLTKQSDDDIGLARINSNPFSSDSVFNKKKSSDGLEKEYIDAVNELRG
jgi:hypothetical protein